MQWPVGPVFKNCRDNSPGYIALLRWYSLVVGLWQPTGHWFSCQMAACHWSPTVARTNEDENGNSTLYLELNSINLKTEYEACRTGDTWS